MSFPTIKMTGDTSVAVVFGDEISYELNKKIRNFDEALAESKIAGIYETVPTYCTLMIHYAPEAIRFEELCKKLEALLSVSHETRESKAVVMEIPVLYGGEYGPDLEYVAQYHGLTTDEVISLHSGNEYLIYMLGFTPGFAYMGGMEESIATPRLEMPRVVIPAGSVGIAGKQTGIYPIDSPGGWQLIGRTPVKMYDAHRKIPILLDAGMYVKFLPIEEAEFLRIRAGAESGEYTCRTYMKEDA